MRIGGPRIADEIDLHQIILVWQRGERLIDRTAQDSKGEFAIDDGLDAARPGALRAEMKDRPARRHGDRAAQRADIDLLAGREDCAVRQCDNGVAAD